MSVAPDRVYPVASWVPAVEWERADPWTREAFARHCADLLREMKRRQIITWIGADGRQLRRVLPTSRPDGTTDRPLVPHDELSRTYRLLKVTANARRGTVTLDWHHWTRIVGYHQAGIRSRRGPVVRDVIGTPGRFLRPVRAAALAWWQARVPVRTYKPPPALPAKPERPRLPRERPTAAVFPAELLAHPISKKPRVFQ